MRLQDFARDTTLVPRSLSVIERSMRGGYITIRVRQIRAADPDPTDVPDADIPALRTQLASEITQAQAAYTTIRSRVDADVTTGELFSLFTPCPGARHALDAISTGVPVVWGQFLTTRSDFSKLRFCSA